VKLLSINSFSQRIINTNSASSPKAGLGVFLPCNVFCLLSFTAKDAEESILQLLTYHYENEKLLES
jgi:hypothetical protein